MSSVDWRHFGTERRPHTCEQREGGVDGMVQREQSPGMIEQYRKKGQSEPTNMEEKASLPTS